MRSVVVAATLVWSACSLAAIERRPPVVEATTRVDCTDTYEFPLVDVAVVAGLIGYSFYVAAQIENGCEGGEGCDPQAPIAIVMPYLYATPFAVSALWGGKHVGRCRDVKRWQARQPFPLAAGEIGQRCIMSIGGPGRCLRSSCIDGMCVDCATPITALERAQDAAERRALFRAMSAGCRRHLASTCGPLLEGALAGHPSPAACRYFLSHVEGAR